MLHRRVVPAVEVEHIDGKLLYLLRAQAAEAAVAHDEVVVYLSDLFLGDVHGNDLADDRNAQALLERAYHDKVCKVYPCVFFLDRSGHDLHADVVIYRAGRNDGVAVLVMREQVERARDKGNDLIHIKLEIGQLVPCRKAKSRYVLVPSAQLGRNKLGVIYKSFPPIYLIYYSIKK